MKAKCLIFGHKIIYDHSEQDEDDRTVLVVSKCEREGCGYEEHHFPYEERVEIVGNKKPI